MEYSEVRRRLSLLAEVFTPDGVRRNAILAVGDDSVTVQSDKPGSRQRKIMYRDIVSGGPTANSRIIASLRQVLGLEAGGVLAAEDDE